MSNVDIFSEIENDIIKVYDNRLKSIFSFIGDGIEYIEYSFVKYNTILITFNTNAMGYIITDDIFKLDQMLNSYLQNKNLGLEYFVFKSNNRKLELQFDTDYTVEIY